MGTDAARFSYMIRRQSYSVLPTDDMVWHHLKGRQTSKIRFERQAVVGDQLVDLYCPAAKLVAELDAPEDGAENRGYLQRIADIEKTGAVVLRFSATQYARCPEKICDAIFNECTKRLDRRRSD